MRIGVYVGSFNPPHKGHLAVVNYVLDKGTVDKVLIVPGQNYWDKQNLVSMTDRLNMLSFFETDKIIVDSVHNKYEYTYEVLNAIKKDYPNDDIYLIIGSDILEKFHMWKNIDEILKYKIIVLKRDNKNIKDMLKKFNTKNFIILEDFINPPVSSSIIRKNINSEYLDERIRDYIIKNKLYESE